MTIGRFVEGLVVDKYRPRVERLPMSTTVIDGPLDPAIRPMSPDPLEVLRDLLRDRLPGARTKENRSWEALKILVEIHAVLISHVADRDDPVRRPANPALNKVPITLADRVARGAPVRICRSRRARIRLAARHAHPRTTLAKRNRRRGLRRTSSSRG